MRLARGWRWGSVLARLEPRGVKLPTVASAPAWPQGSRVAMVLTFLTLSCWSCALSVTMDQGRVGWVLAGQSSEDQRPVRASNCLQT